jgi:hypothetical protein
MRALPTRSYTVAIPPSCNWIQELAGLQRCLFRNNGMTRDLVAVMAQAQKPVFVFRWNGRVHVFWQGVTVQSAIGSRGVHVGL